MNFILPRPKCNVCTWGVNGWSVSMKSNQKKYLRTFEPNAILGWLLEIPLVPIFESLEPHSFLGCDPFVLLPLQPCIVFLFGLLALSHARTTTSIVPAFLGRARAGRVGVMMVTFAGGFSVRLVALTTIASTVVVSVVLGTRRRTIPTTKGA